MEVVYTSCIYKSIARTNIIMGEQHKRGISVYRGTADLE